MSTTGGKVTGGKVNFGADKVKISGPRIDGSYSVTFETGEYEREKVADLLRVPPETSLKVEVTYGQQ